MCGCFLFVVVLQTQKNQGEDDSYQEQMRRLLRIEKEEFMKV